MPLQDQIFAKRFEILWGHFVERFPDKAEKGSSDMAVLFYGARTPFLGPQQSLKPIDDRQCREFRGNFGGLR
jgi:hypothetical protein